jgi:hypothetical protein
MGMAARAVAGRDLSDGGHHIVACREIDGLQRRALDAGLLGKRCNRDGRRGNGRSDERFLEQSGSSLDTIEMSGVDEHRGCMIRTPNISGDPMLRNPITGLRCARSASGQAAGRQGPQ